MIIPDILRCNDWKISTFNIFILTTLGAYDCSFLSYNFIYSYKIVSQILGFFIITFVFGYIILRILRIHNIDRVVNLLLTIGLSLFFVMFFGFLFNLFLPALGVLNPLSTIPLFCILNITILILLLICYLRDKNYSSTKNELLVTFSSMILYLFLMPILSIVGTYFMNYYNSNIVIMILLFLISLSPLLVYFEKIQANLYPLAILSISISILLQMNLISTHLWSYDIFYGAYTTNFVLNNARWIPSLDFLSPVLLFNILAPIYSSICSLNNVWVFKIIFPIIFSFTPLALYKLYEKINFGDYKPDQKMAFLSVLVFVFFYGFFKDVPDKQHISEFFLALILMIVAINNPKGSILLYIISFSLVTSHYGVSYIFMLCLLFLIIFKKFYIGDKKSLLSLYYMIFFSLLTVGWYQYASDGYQTKNAIQIVKTTLATLTEIFPPQARTGLDYAYHPTTDWLWFIYKIIHIILQFCIFIGFFKLLLSIKRRMDFFEIPLISIAFYIFLITQMFTSYGMGLDRIIQLTLILLSPLALWGIVTISELLVPIYTKNASVLNSNKILKKLNPNLAWPSNIKSQRNVYQTGVFYFAIFLMFFFIFNSGLIFQVADSKLPAYCINLNNNAGWPVYSESEVSGVNWLKYYKNERVNVAVFNIESSIKSRDGLLLKERFNQNSLIRLLPETKKLRTTYIFLGRYSISEVEYDKGEISLGDTEFYKNVLIKSNKIYDSHNTNLYFSK